MRNGPDEDGSLIYVYKSTWGQWSKYGGEGPQPSEGLFMRTMGVSLSPFQLSPTCSCGHGFTIQSFRGNHAAQVSLRAQGTAPSWNTTNFVAILPHTRSPLSLPFKCSNGESPPCGNMQIKIPEAPEPDLEFPTQDTKLIIDLRRPHEQASSLGPLLRRAALLARSQFNSTARPDSDVYVVHGTSSS